MNRLKKSPLLRKQPAILGLAAMLVALLVMPSSASVNPRGGTWKGTTAQGLPIEFVVKKKSKGWKVVRVEYKVTRTCTGALPGQPPVTTASTVTQVFPVRRADDGTVDSGNSYEQRWSAWIWSHLGGGEADGGSGNFSAILGRFLDRRKAKGSLHDELEIHHPAVGDHVCQSGTVRWTARR